MHMLRGGTNLLPDDARVLGHTRGARRQSAVLPGDLELVEVGVEVRKPGREIRQLHASFFRFFEKPIFHCRGGWSALRGEGSTDDTTEHGTT